MVQVAAAGKGCQATEAVVDFNSMENSAWYLIACNPCTSANPEFTTRQKFQQNSLQINLYKSRACAVMGTVHTRMTTAQDDSQNGRRELQQKCWGRKRNHYTCNLQSCHLQYKFLKVATIAFAEGSGLNISHVVAPLGSALASVGQQRISVKSKPCTLRMHLAPTFVRH